MTKSARLDALASPSSKSGNGSFSLIVKPLSPSGFISSTTGFNDWPSPSRAIQRLIEATQSAPRTGLAS